MSIRGGAGLSFEAGGGEGSDGVALSGAPARDLNKPLRIRHVCHNSETAYQVLHAT